MVPPQLHLAEDSFPLHLLLEHLERLIDIVITYQNLHLAAFSFLALSSRSRNVTSGPRLAIPTRGRAVYHGNGVPPNDIAQSRCGGRMAILKIARMGHPV